MSNVPGADVGDELGDDAALDEDDTLGAEDELGVPADVADALDDVEPHPEQAIENPTRIAAAARFMRVSTYAVVGRF